MKKILALAGFLLIVLLIWLNFYIKDNFYVCPDGNKVSFNFQCKKFEPPAIDKPVDNISVDMSYSEDYFIKSGGKINVTFILREEYIGITFYPHSHSPNSEFRYIYPQAEYDLVGFTEGSDFQPVKIRDVDRVPYVKEYESLPPVEYWTNITAPTVPGKYILYIRASKSSTYESQNITVINKTDETLAYAIAERQIYAPIGGMASKNWKIVSKSAIDRGNYFEVSIENSFDFCDFEIETCYKKYVSGKYLISKETGQIVG